jgi:hypothetical protein
MEEEIQKCREKCLQHGEKMENYNAVFMGGVSDQSRDRREGLGSHGYGDVDDDDDDDDVDEFDENVIIRLTEMAVHSLLTVYE